MFSTFIMVIIYILAFPIVIKYVFNIFDIFMIINIFSFYFIVIHNIKIFIDIINIKQI